MMKIRLSEKDPRTLSPGALQNEMKKLGEISSQLASLLIVAGRGYEKFNDMAKKTDEISVAYVKVARRQQSLYFEKNRRLKYHGSLKRTLSDGA